MRVPKLCRLALPLPDMIGDYRIATQKDKYGSADEGKKPASDFLEK